MKKINRVGFAGLLIAFATFTSGLARADIVIDAFDTTTQETIIFPVNVPFSSAATAPGEAVGGERDISLTRVSSDGSVAADANGTIPGAATYSSGPTVTGNALYVWDGVDGAEAIDFDGLGGIDLTQTGLNLGIGGKTTSDLGAQLILTIYTDGGNFSTATIPIVADPTFTFADFFVPFASFSIGAGTGADFTNVGAITMYINGSTAGTDVGVQFLTATIPEPSAFWMVFFGCSYLLGRCVRRRR